MLKALLIRVSRLLARTHVEQGPLLDDLDGACPVCDHPFGSLSHSCIGAGTRIAA